METVDWTVSWSTDEDAGVCCGVANGIHLAALPIAIATWRREGVGGRGYRRHVDINADDGVVDVKEEDYVGVLERGERPLAMAM